MGQERANNLQGHRLPSSRFASFPSRRPTPADRARRLRNALTLLVAAISLAAAPAQTPSPQAGATVVAQRRARVQRFLAGRAVGPAQPATTSAEALQKARAQHLALLQRQQTQPQSSNLTVAWQALGPGSIVSSTFGNLTGRITSIVTDPNDITGASIYLGTTGGGVWKSTNAAGPLSGVTFTPLTDTLPVFSANAGSSVIPSLSIGALAMQFSTTPALLAGTGDPNDATDSLYGEGILRSADHGLTWTLIQNSQHSANATYSFSGLATAGLAFSTATPTLAVAAFSTSAESAIVEATNTASVPGLFYSTDAGQSWLMATLYDGAAVVQGPQPLGTGQVGNAVTSVVWDALRGRFFAAVRSHGYYSSSDGATWTRLAAQPGTGLTTANCPVGVNGTGSANCPIFRGTLAVRADTGDLYALTVDVNNLDQGLWQDLCNAGGSSSCATPAPTFGSRLDNGALEIGNGSTVVPQGSYNLTLAAAAVTGGNASSGTLLFAGTIDLYRCSIASGATSCTFRNTTNALNGCNAPAAVAPSQHALAAIGRANDVPLLYLGNDGGLWRSIDGVAQTGSVCSATDAAHFDNLNLAIGDIATGGGSLAEITGFAQHPTSLDTLLAGLGANGSAASITATKLTPWPQVSAGEGGYPSLDPTTPTNWYISIGAGVNLKQCVLGSACTGASFVPPATIGEAQVSYDASLIDAPTLLDPAQSANLLVATCRVWRGTASTGTTWSTSNAISPALNGGATPCGATSPFIRSIAAGGPSTGSANPQSSGSEVIYAGLAGLLDGGGNAIPGHLFVTRSANTATGATAWTDTALPNAVDFDVASIAADPHDATGATVYAAVQGFGVGHLYRSVDFGAHWANVSSNLPNAPANAVLVDPNDANTVYLAMDTGVYVTQAIATCAATNCWSVFGTALPNSPVVALAAGPLLLTGDGRHGMLRAGTYGRGIWQQPLVTAISLSQPAITLSATSFTFAAQQVATQSAAQTLTVTSSGNSAVTFGTPAIAGDFAETDTCASKTLAVGATCTVQIVFAPTATGARAGQLTLYANIAGGQATVALAGVGTAPPAIILTPLSLTFAATLVNQTSAAQIITVANTGGNSATLQTPLLTGDFLFTANTCGATLAASTACALSIAFKPIASGTRSGTLSITDSAGTQTAQLTGVGNAPATDTLAPLALTFVQQQIGTTSPTQNVTLTNAGDVALTLIAAAIPAGDFTVVNACGNSLAAHATCALNVAFIPTATGARTGTMTVTDQFRSQTVTLNGIGVAPPGVSLSPAALSFPATGVGLTAPAQTLTLTNNGGLPLTISKIAASAGFVIATNTCAATLAPSAACTLQIVFAPTIAGPVAGTLTLTDNAPSATQTAALTGIGVDFTLAAAGPTSVTIASGATATYPLLLSSLAGLSGNVAMDCSPRPSHGTCTVTPATGGLGATVSVVVTVQTGLATASVIPPASPFRPRDGAIFLALLLPLGLLFRRARNRLLPLGCVVLTLPSLTPLNGCGAGRLIPPATTTPTPVTPTPSGTYNLTISGSSAGLTHTVGLTLIVQ